MRKTISLYATIGILAFFALFVGCDVYTTNRAARDLYDAHNANDSITFVELYTMADHDVVRTYKRMIADSIKLENEYYTSKDNAINAWHNR